jgi:hypothetical protein
LIFFSLASIGLRWCFARCILWVRQSNTNGHKGQRKENIMAATAVIDGHYVNATYKEWDAFNDARTGEEVKGGRKFVARIFTPHDDDLVEVKADAAQLDAFRAALAGATFGVKVRIICAVTKWGHIGYSAEILSAPAAPAAKAS